MKIVFILLFLAMPFLGSSQERVFSIRYVSSNVYPAVEGIMPAKGNPRIVVSDSTFQQVIGKNVISYSITKKINDNYFKATDGLKDYIIKISDQDIGRWKHSIRIESGEDVTTFLTID